MLNSTLRVHTSSKMRFVRVAASWIRQCLRKARTFSPLFDTAGWVKDLEQLLLLLLDSRNYLRALSSAAPLLHIVAATGS